MDELYIPRRPDLAVWAGQKSYFLFGPRQTGKTSLIQHALPDARVYDFLDHALFLALSHRHSRLTKPADATGPWSSTMSSGSPSC